MSTSKKHVFPDSIAKEVQKALSYYPSLKDISIKIQFKKKIKKSTMLAQPDFGSIFKLRAQRKYHILISETFQISNQEFSTKDIPSDVMIGWIGHELGHIVDYETKSSLGLVWFGLRYLFSTKHIIEAERMADTYAVNRGMREYILETKNFILNHAEIEERYKLRMKKFYLSPEEIMDIVEHR